MSEFKDWYDGIPYFTRWWLTLTIVFSLLGRFSLLDPRSLILAYEPFVHRFQIWRPFTALFFYPTSFHFLINCYFLYNYSMRLESGVFLGRPADYCFMLMFTFVACVIIALLAEIPLIMDPMVLSVLYVWCQLNKDVIVSFWFGTRFKAMYLPWVLAAFNIVVNGGGLMDLLGILVGHLAFFLIFKYPQEFGGPALLSTPQFLRDLFPNSRVMGGFGSVPQTRPQPTDAAAPAGGGGGFFGGHTWGRGQTLGGN